ncbi:unnamed protein product [Pedinophyceae sp. YPF-701]|nr:unnamed protein product [Pedinophyceae sp. YPF-701]
MGGKGNVSAKARKAEKDAAMSELKAKEKEDMEWAQAGDGALTKGQAKKLEAERKRMEKLEKKQEKQALHDEEIEEATAKKQKEKWRYDKPTAHEILKAKEADHAEKMRKREEWVKAQRREMSERDYARLVDVVINNKRDDFVDASNLADAVRQLEAMELRGSTSSPKVAMTFKLYYPRKIEELKAEKPGLKLTQYKDLAWNAWQRSPENPKNQQ